MKPLFIPLKTEYYEAFADGSKREELRRYGPRWNERTCMVGRDVILSKGYGKQGRMTGRIWKFKRQHGSTFGSTYQAAILDVFGTLDIEIACVAIELTHNMEFSPALKKEPISVKLPKWLLEWMDTQPESRAVLIEEALKRQHKIKPPEVKP